jgi:hypothetical protein
MGALDDIPPTERADLSETELRSREERQKRWADVHAGRIPPDIEASPEMQALRRQHDEFRARIKAHIRNITGR